MTRDGVAVGHWVFPGAAPDHQVTPAALQDVKARWPIPRLMIVRDRGRLAPDLVDGLVATGSPCGASRGDTTGGSTRCSVNGDGTIRSTQPTAHGPGAGKKRRGPKALRAFWTSDRLILADNPDRASEGAALRQGLRDPLTAAIAGGSVRSLRNGYRRSVVTDGMIVRLDARACQEDACLDTHVVLRTNTRLPRAEAITAHQQAWPIEWAFRTLKTPRDLRPVFQGTDA